MKNLIIGIISLLSVIILLSSCSGVSQTDHNKLNNDLTNVNAIVASLQNDLTTANNLAASLRIDLNTANAKVASLQSDLNTANTEILALKTISPSPAGILEVSYDELSSVAASNEIAFDSQYRGRLIQMSHLRVVKVMSTADPRVDFLSQGGRSFTLYFASTIGLEKLTPTMLVTVYGTSRGVYSGKPWFDSDCVLVRIE